MYDLDTAMEMQWAGFAAPGFAELVERHKRLVLRTAWRMLGRLEDAEDITQEVFLKLHRQGGDPGPSWMYRVTVNLCLDEIRKRKPEVEEEVLDQIEAPGVSLDEKVEMRRREERLARLIARLPERERACLVLRELEGLTSPEAAAILDCSEETVRTAVHRAKEKLRQWMR